MIGNKKIIGICISRIQDEASNEYITALNDAVSGQGYNIFVYNTCSLLDTEQCQKDAQFYVFNLMDYSVLDALIIFEEVIQNDTVVETLIQRATSHDVPVLIIGEPHEGCINIKFDHKNGFSEIVRHVIREHHLKKLHFMAGSKGNMFSEYRLEAFRQVLEEFQLPFDDSMVSYGDFWSDPAEAATEKIIESGHLPEAILCANDKMAIAVCGVLNKHGIKIPEEVAVTGFDGIPEIGFSSPRITSASCDVADLAAKTLEVLENIETWKHKTVGFLVLPRISLAESCGCKAKEPVDASRYLNELNDRFYLFQDEAIMLSELTAKIQRCDSIDQVIAHLRHGIFYDMCCVVEKDYLNESVNPVVQEEKDCMTDKEMLLLFDSNHVENFRPYAFSRNEIIPSLDYCLEHGRVIVFTALHHMGVPMGYVSFYFNRLTRRNSSRITQMVRELNNALGGYRDRRYQNFLIQQIDEMYRIDSLTGLYNRRGFASAYQKLLEEKQEKLPLTIILADLDRLKYINDTFGHKEGDFAIHAVAKALKFVCPPNSLFTRFGGDEMLAVCFDRIEPEKIRGDFAKYFKAFNETSNKAYAVEASVGVYVVEGDAVLSFEELIEKSDRLMYEEKERHHKKTQNN